MENVVYIPFDRSLYNDMVWCSSGKLDPARMAEEQVRMLMETNLDDFVQDWFGENFTAFVERQFPERLDEFVNETDITTRPEIPLLWKFIRIPEGTGVRMLYDGKYHYAQVLKGKVADSGGEFSPSKWVRKVARNTSRNAWIDVEFNMPSRGWVLADTLREEYIESLNIDDI